MKQFNFHKPTKQQGIVAAGAVAVLAVGVGIGAASGSSAAPKAAPAPAVTVTAPAAPAPAVTVIVLAAPAPAVTVTAPAKPALTVTVTEKAAPAPTVTVTAPAAQAPATQAPAVQAPADSQAPPNSSMTAAQQQAVDSAKSYLSGGMGFSEQGLLKQLTSSYGEGFSKSDAQFAISYLHPDWNAQAVQSAKNYLSGGQGFSRQSLIEQLTSSYGEGFTQAQAEYAVSQVGL